MSGVVDGRGSGASPGERHSLETASPRQSIDSPRPRSYH